MKTQSLADFLIGNPQLNVFFAIISENLQSKKFVASKENEVFVKVLTDKGYLKEGFFTENGLKEAKSINPDKVKELNLGSDFWEKLKKFELPKDEPKTEPKTEAKPEPKPEGTPAPAQIEKKDVLEIPQTEFDKILAQIHDLQNQVQNLHSKQEKIQKMSIFDIEEKLEHYYNFQKELDGLETAKMDLDQFIKRLNSPVNEDELKITLHCGSSQKTIRVFGSVQKCANLINDIATEHIDTLKKEMESLTSIL